MNKVPILFIVYNRPLETERSFAVIREHRPSRLYVAVDGPKSAEDKVEIDRVLEIVRNVDWDCDVKYLTNEVNLGCKTAVNRALDWFFKNEEQGIILEDDILPDPSFFEFCKVCLDRYKEDTRIMLITGNNLLGEYPTDADYHFSQIGAIWGWASWRRAWELHDKEIEIWPLIKDTKLLANFFPEEMWEERKNYCDAVYSGEIDTWDYQFTLTRLVNSGLSIIPSVNLISNIGFNVNATHTTSSPFHFDNLKREIETSELIHPKVVVADLAFDREIFERRKEKTSFTSRLMRKLRK